MSIEFVRTLWHFPRRIGMVENGRQAWVFLLSFFSGGMVLVVAFFPCHDVCFSSKGRPFPLRRALLWWEGEIVFWISASVHNMYGHTDHFWVWVSTRTVWLSSSSSFYTFMWRTGSSFLFGRDQDGMEPTVGGCDTQKTDGDRQGEKIVRWID